MSLTNFLVIGMVILVNLHACVCIKHWCLVLGDKAEPYVK